MRFLGILKWEQADIVLLITKLVFPDIVFPCLLLSDLRLLLSYHNWLLKKSGQIHLEDYGQGIKMLSGARSFVLLLCLANLVSFS